MTQVQANEIAKINSHIARGGKIMIGTAVRWTRIDTKAVKAWEKAGYTLLKEEGEGYRMRQGKKSAYLFTNQMFYA